MTAERLLVLLLRLSAVILFTAIVPVFFPYSWMDRGHQMLGLGELPRLPLIEYLNRTISALYVCLGVFTWMIADDVVRYRPLVAFWGWYHIAFGVLALGVGLHAGMPWFWVAVEGPLLIVAGVVVLVLLKRVAGPLA